MDNIYLIYLIIKHMLLPRVPEQVVEKKGVKQEGDDPLWVFPWFGSL
jgi:hypothetical protein